MPETFQALGVFILALLPGALYVWSFERLAGAWGTRFADRLVRFVGVSAVFHALIAPVTYRLWIEFVISGRLAREDVPLWLWPAALLYIAVPILAGTLIGFGTRRGWRWTKIFTGPEPAPRAWDHLFARRPDGWILLHLKSGVWLGGAYAADATGGQKSYAAGYPDEQDLYLAEAAEVDPITGQFVYGADGRPKRTGSGILIRWSEVEHLEFTEA